MLDACIHRRERRRLARVLEELPRSKVQPTVRTYGLLIKACSVLTHAVQCLDFGNEMVKQGILSINVVPGCILDALEEARNVEQAWPCSNPGSPR